MKMEIKEDIKSVQKIFVQIVNDSDVILKYIHDNNNVFSKWDGFSDERDEVVEIKDLASKAILLCSEIIESSDDKFVKKKFDELLRLYNIIIPKVEKNEKKVLNEEVKISNKVNEAIEHQEKKTGVKDWFKRVFKKPSRKYWVSLAAGLALIGGSVSGGGDLKFENPNDVNGTKIENVQKVDSLSSSVFSVEDMKVIEDLHKRHEAKHLQDRDIDTINDLLTRIEKNNPEYKELLMLKSLITNVIANRSANNNQKNNLTESNKQQKGGVITVKDANYNSYKSNLSKLKKLQKEINKEYSLIYKNKPSNFGIDNLKGEFINDSRVEIIKLCDSLFDIELQKFSALGGKLESNVKSGEDALESLLSSKKGYFGSFKIDAKYLARLDSVFVSAANQFNLEKNSVKKSEFLKYFNKVNPYIKAEIKILKKINEVLGDKAFEKGISFSDLKDMKKDLKEDLQELGVGRELVKEYEVLSKQNDILKQIFNIQIQKYNEINKNNFKAGDFNMNMLRISTAYLNTLEDIIKVEKKSKLKKMMQNEVFLIKEYVKLTSQIK